MYPMPSFRFSLANSKSKISLHMTIFGKIREELMTDRAVLYSVMERGWAISANLVTILLVFRFLTPDEQGYFTTFRNFIAFRFVAEFGLTYAAMQIASHEMVGVEIKDGYLQGDPVHIKRLASLVRLMIQWYAVASSLYLIVMLFVGIKFFRDGSSASQVDWMVPWVITVVTTSLVIFLSPLMAILEGMGLVADVVFYRLLGGFFGSWVVWVLLFMHQRLFAVSIILLPEVIANIAYVFFVRRKLYQKLMPTYDRNCAINWRRDIFPFQWRISVSYIAGYIQAQVLGPIVFHYRGPAEAGQVGISLNAMSAISAIASAWVQSKAPTMGKLIAKRKFKELDELYFPAVDRVMVASALVIAVLVAMVVALNQFHIPDANRLLPPIPFTFIMLAALANSILACQGMYMRAHKQDPYYVMYIVMAVALTVVELLIASHFGSNVLAFAYFVALAIFLVPSTIILQKKRKAWHEDPSQIEAVDLQLNEGPME